MRLLLIFLFATFVVGGTTRGERLISRPLVLLGACVVVGAMFYSERAL